MKFGSGLLSACQLGSISSIDIKGGNRTFAACGMKVLSAAKAPIFVPGQNSLFDPRLNSSLLSARRFFSISIPSVGASRRCALLRPWRPGDSGSHQDQRTCK